MGRNTRKRLGELVLLIVLLVAYKLVAYLFANAFWLLCARFVLLAVILALLLNLLFPSK